MTLEPPEEERPFRQASGDVVRARPDALATVEGLRRRDLQSLSDRLEVVERPPRSRRWNTAAVTMGSVALGSAVTGIPLLSAEIHVWVFRAYGAAILICLLIAGICWRAGQSASAERADSVASIKASLDALLAAYPRERPAPSVLRGALQRLRAEARDNRRLIQRGIDTQEYWRATETGLRTAEWTESKTLLEGEPGLEDVYDDGGEACQQIERVVAAITWRTFRRERPVRESDRLGDAVAALDRFIETLSASMARLGDG